MYIYTRACVWPESWSRCEFQIARRIHKWQAERRDHSFEVVPIYIYISLWNWKWRGVEWSTSTRHASGQQMRFATISRRVVRRTGDSFAFSFPLYTIAEHPRSTLSVSVFRRRSPRDTRDLIRAISGVYRDWIIVWLMIFCFAIFLPLTSFFQRDTQFLHFILTRMHVDGFSRETLRSVTSVMVSRDIYVSRARTSWSSIAELCIKYLCRRTRRVKFQQWSFVTRRKVFQNNFFFFSKIKVSEVSDISGAVEPRQRFERVLPTRRISL